MQLIMKIRIVDEDTDTMFDTLPFNYTSASDAIEDLKQVWSELFEKNDPLNQTFEYAGHTFRISDFYDDTLDRFVAPEILTVEEWFNKYG